MPASSREAVDALIGQAKRSWARMGRMSQAHLALALKRRGDADTPVAILKSIREAATDDEEQGLFWRDLEGDSGAAIEAQSLMIEAFLEVSADAAAAEACKVWLLRQKQVSDWRTTKATADTVFALLLQGRALLGSEANVEVTLGDQLVVPERVEPGTGFFETRYASEAVRPDMGKVKVTKRDQGLAWGALHWQYLEDMDQIKPDEGSPLAVRKQLFVKTLTPQGPLLTPVQGVVPQGAELITRLEIRADRALTFVHVKDNRASCAEPEDVGSGFRWQDGLGYYVSTRDAATHFFLDEVGKGVHVLEYACRVQQKGVFRSGVAEIQCMYAPGIGGHSGLAVFRVE